MSYEDFVEGIKPAITSQVDEEEETTEVDKKNTLSYHLVDGIFKRMCKVAQYTPSTATATFSLSDDQFNKSAFYKVSLGRANNAEGDTVYRYCIENNLIAMGWGGWKDYSGKSEQEINELLKEDKISSSDATFIKRFSHRLRIGDYVIVSEGNYWCRAIGRVTGEYEYDEDGPNEYLHFRKVQWLIKDVQIPVEHIYSRQFSMQTLYSLDKGALKKEFFVKDKNEFLSTAGYAGNYVLIIDEINRGNVSHIFGELITLIEDSKREGKDEALEVTLPYSGEKFSVPANLYIIGTMNTADRSVEALDTALRRRFDFEEMNPIPSEVKPSHMGKVNLVKMLETINRRLRVLLDKDRNIGHAWLMNIITIEDLKSVFKNRILPLLQEFFYSQQVKIGWVLGDAFVKEEKPTANIFAAFETDLDKPDLDEAKVYTFLSIDEMEEKHFINIYDPSVLK